ncbi:MAG TPA: hypothetical protein EYQ00_00905 [Dehalococcoidia bacterium]|nr:hypothetical protein [Dehalococcoidia bacterium]
MQSPNMNVLSAISSLRADNNFKIFLDWLDESLDEIDKQNRYKSGEDLYRAQGTAQNLDDLIKRIEDAPSALRKLREAR